MGHARQWIIVLSAAAVLASCDKVPITDINARFTLADAAWFEQEQTLFFFWRIEAEQGIGPESQLELTWRSDDAEQPWAPVAQLPTVHTHVAGDCARIGTDSSSDGGSSPSPLTVVCGSTSLRVVGEPRFVALRLRYHRDGEMTLNPAKMVFNVVRSGPAHTNRSLVIYGVFDEQNRQVQWRARHQFPTLRNQDVEALGLRRHFVVSDARYGDFGVPLEHNLYGYGVAPNCPDPMAPLGWAPIETSDRAIFDSSVLPLAASTSPVICANSTVTDATGTFTAVALARKNPDVRPAFPSLRSPIRLNTQIGFVLRPCARTISAEHLSMQVQRLLLAGAPEICIDDWSQPGFADMLATRFRAAFDTVRPQGNDMVLLLALHHDDSSGRLAAVLEDALDQVLPPEQAKSSPRVSGAFVFDSITHSLGTPELERMVLWCPANMIGDDLDLIPGAAQRSCPVMPDLPDLQLGPFKFGNLPILPTRPQYLRFLEKYSEAQGGRMKSLEFRAPERTPISENVAIGEYAVATFFNGEVLTPEPDDAFSYCAPEQGLNPVVFRVSLNELPAPLEMLPTVHDLEPQPSYQLGLLWDFPFLLRLQYEVVLAGSATAYGLSVPFGVGTTTEAYYGTQQWQAGEFPLDQVLLQCDRFCDHPTFDSAGVYNVGAPFTPTYRNQCYRPKYPVPPGGGFPLDP